jgi:hypothetical protein
VPTRVIRDGILTSETIASLSLGAQLLYHCLLLVVDDHGLYEASPRILRSKCFPLRDDGSPHPVTTEMVAGWLDECMAASGLLLTYEVGGKRYLQVQRFKQQWKKSKAKFPTPPTATVHEMPARPAPVKIDDAGAETLALAIIERHPHPQKMKPDEFIRSVISKQQPNEELIDVLREIDRNHRALCALSVEDGGWKGGSLKFKQVPALRDWVWRSRDPTAMPAPVETPQRGAVEY